MKILLSLGLALGAIALMGGAPNTAHAVDAQHAGTICKNYNAGQVTDIDYLVSGTRNLNASPRYVICPLVAAPVTTAGGSRAMYVDGSSTSGQTISCTVYSYNYNGAYLGSKSFPATAGTFDMYLTVPATYWSTSNVLCLLPPSATGVLYDIDVVQ